MKAKEMAQKHREISISEFFEKNRHLLGYDNKVKALLMIVKEGVDNALDATEEARILPDIYVKVKEIKPEIYEIVIKDNGPGIVKSHIPKIFGKLLYGSKFHRLKQNRGQQGIGISAATLYTQLTTGKPLEIKSSVGDGVTHIYKIKIDIRKNEPIILESREERGDIWHGVELRFITEGVYRDYKQSIHEYLKQTAIANPYANITFDSPKGVIKFTRTVDKLPKEAKEIKPHILGVELGIMSRMLMNTKAKTLIGFLTTEFTKLGRKTAKEICKTAEVNENAKPKKLTDEEIKRIMEAAKSVKLQKPPTNCLSPLGSDVITEGLKKELNPELVEAITRPPEVYRGWPFQVEVGIAYGGSITQGKLMRFANRVPLLYQQGDCAITKAITGIDWRRYGLGGDVFENPVVIFVHVVSVWVPFTSESKEAIASYPVIIKEIKLATQEVARKLKTYLSGKRRQAYHQQRMKTFEKYANLTVQALSELSGERREKVKNMLIELINTKRNVKEVDENEVKRSGEAEEAGSECAGADKEKRESEDRDSHQVTLEHILRREEKTHQIRN